MQTAQDALGWAAAGVFLILAAAAVAGWLARRERGEARLAWAMGLFGASLLARSAVALAYTGRPPEPLRVMTPILILLSVYAFMIFLADFVRFAWWAHLIAAGLTLVMVALTVIEKPDIALVNGQIVHTPGHNLMDFVAFVKLLYAYLAASFGFLALVFIAYGRRVAGMARGRMLTTAAGFAVLFVSAGIVPRVLIGRPAGTTIAWILIANLALIIVSAPLLFLGFTPPAKILQRLQRAQRTAA